MNYNHVFITGGAGFIGCNFAAVLLAEGHTVTIFDNLSRPGTPLNLAWLQQPHPRFVRGDICDYSALQKAMTGTDVVYHLGVTKIS